MQEDIITTVSRNLARALFPNSSYGRTISKMTADALGTDTKTVHAIMIAGGLIWLSSRKQ